jgi:chromosome segregation ATPase
MAEEFHDAFDVGDSDEHINSINADGVAFAAVQGLSAKLDDTREELDDAREELDEKAERIADLEAENERLRERNAELESRLAAVEDHLGLDSGASTRGVADD